MKNYSVILSALLILPAARVFAEPSKSKCARAIIHAARGPGNYDSDFTLTEKNGDIFVSSGDQKAKIEKDEGKLQLYRTFTSNAVMETSSSYKDKIIFERQNGQYNKVTIIGGGSTTVSTLNENCELDQVITDDKVVEYDRTLCDRVAEKMAGGFFNESFSMESFAKCERLGNSIAKVMNTRDFEIREASNQKRSIPGAADSFGTPAYSAIFLCARELNYAKKQNGVFTKAQEFSTQWLKDAFDVARTKTAPEKKPSKAMK